MADALDKTVKYEQLLISRLTIAIVRQMDYIRNNNPLLFLNLIPPQFLTFKIIRISANIIRDLTRDELD